MATTQLSSSVLDSLVQLSSESDYSLPEGMSVIDHLLFGLVQENVQPSLGLAAYKNIVNGFQGFNEIRVSHPRELESLMEGIPGAEQKARRILEVLRFTFDTTYSFDLESMRKKPVKQVQKQLSKISGTTKFAVAATVQRALGGHAFPVDESMRKVLVEFAVASPEETVDSIAAMLEEKVSKANASAFTMFIGELAGDTRKLASVRKQIAEQSNGKLTSKPKAKSVPKKATKKA